MKKIIILLLSLTFGVINVNAQNKTGIDNSTIDFSGLKKATEGMDFSKPARPLPKPWSVGYANIQGAIKPNTWYWVGAATPSYKISPNDMYNLYGTSKIYENAYSQALPMQFIKEGDVYLPHIILTRYILSTDEIDPKRVKNLSEYLPLLDKENPIFINANLDKVISTNQAGISTHYISIKKVEGTIKVIEVKAVVFKVQVFNYYPSQKVKTKTVYMYHFKETDKKLTMYTDLYKDDANGKIINEVSTSTIKLNDISNEIVRALFAKNQK